jgi:DHA2 family multidrug resistance protein
MMRQLGGSFGVSIINTYVAHRVASHRNDLVSNIRPDNTLAMERIRAYTRYFEHKGFGYSDARLRAMKVIDNIVFKQSALLSYREAFILVGLFFIVTLPLLLFVMKRAKNKNPTIILSDH